MNQLLDRTLLIEDDIFKPYTKKEMKKIRPPLPEKTKRIIIAKIMDELDENSTMEALITEIYRNIDIKYEKYDDVADFIAQVCSPLAKGAAQSYKRASKMWQEFKYGKVLF